MSTTTIYNGEMLRTHTDITHTPQTLQNQTECIDCHVVTYTGTHACVYDSIIARGGRGVNYLQKKMGNTTTTRAGTNQIWSLTEQRVAGVRVLLLNSIVDYHGTSKHRRGDADETA